MLKKFLFCSLGIVIALAISSTGYAATSPLQLNDLLSMARLPFQSGPAVGISPDGTRVFYGLEVPFSGDTVGSDPIHDGRKQLWVKNLVDQSLVQLGDTNLDNYEAVWSPDGKKLAFYTGSGSYDKVAVWDVATRTIHVLNILVDAKWVPLPLEWAPDSLHIVVPQIPGNHVPALAEKEAQPTVSPSPGITVFTSVPTKKTILGNDVIGPSPFSFLSPIDLMLVNTQTGESTPIAKNVTTAFYRLSPDGTKLLYTVSTGVVSGDINDRVVYDVYVANVTSGSSERIAQGMLSNLGSPMSWSHDGSKIAFAGGNLQNDASGAPAGNSGSSFPARCYVIDLQHPGIFHALSNPIFERGTIWWGDNDSTIYVPTWDKSGIVAIAIATRKAMPLLKVHSATIKDILGLKGNHLTLLVTADDGATQIQQVDIHSGSVTALFHGYASVSDVSFSRSGGGPIAYVQADVAHPADVWVADSSFLNPHQLTHFNPQIEQRSLSDAEESITWHARNGTLLNGVLLLPAGYQAGRRYPTILWVYAGENEGSLNRDSFGMFGEQRAGSYFNLELLASRGYAVFVPNSVLRVGHPMRDIAHEILPGIDKIIALGVADPSKLGVFGQSYGGYSTFALIVQTNRFKAAIATSGISDLVSDYGFLHKDGSDWTGLYESEQGRMGGTPWQYRSRYIENSPFFYLDRVQTPVLIEYGEDDSAVAPYQSWEAFVGLRRLGKTATLVGYPNEGHVLTTTAHQRDFWQRMVDWFTIYIPSA